MAGVKGRSGGARANSGGKRAGAGRKKRVAADQPASVPGPPAVVPASEPSPTQYDDPISFLRDAVNNARMSDSSRIAAARTWAILEKRGILAPPRPKGKKETQKEAAAEEASGGGVFGMRRPPKLVAAS